MKYGKEGVKTVLKINKKAMEILLSLIIVIIGALCGVGLFIWATTPPLKKSWLSECSNYPVGTRPPESCNVLILPLTMIAVGLPLVVIVDIAVGWKKVFSKVFEKKGKDSQS